MKPVNTLFATAALTLSLAALGATTARAAGVEVLNEGFDNVGALSGWALVNNSIPIGNAWFQGNPDVFPSQAGAPDAYAAANFLGAANGGGSVDNWLITPVLALSGTTVLSFYTRHDALPGFDDLLEVRFEAGTGTDAADFTSLLTTIGGTAGYPTDWQQYMATVTSNGSGRFAFRHAGPADTLNYVGLDTVSVVTAVPEPASWMMLALGVGLLTLLRRQSRP
jgi:hypothetical protein